MSAEPNLRTEDDSSAAPSGSLTEDDLASLIGEARRLAEDARTLAEAEVAFQVSRARLVVASTGWIAGLGLAALVFAVFALGALTVGLLLALATVLGPWWAMAAVAGGLALIALACVLFVRARWRRIIRLAFARNDAND